MEPIEETEEDIVTFYLSQVNLETGEITPPVGEVEKTPFAVVRPEVIGEAMQYSRVLDSDTFVRWGEGAIRFDSPFLTIFNSKGGAVANPGDFVIKTGDDFTVLGPDDFATTYEGL